MTDDPDCPFCAITHGRDEAVEFVCEAAEWVAFFPLEPATPGHTLVVPRTHVTDLWSSPDDLASELMLAVLRVGGSVQRVLEPEGMNLITSSGTAAEQTVFHLHLHVVPRWRADGFGRIWPLEDKRYSDERLEELARRIRDACGGVD